MAQPDDHPPAGGLLHRLLTLTPSQGGGGCFLLHGLLLPIASIFGSGVLCAARTFLPRISCVSGRAGALFSVCKVTVNVANDKEKCFIFYISGIPPLRRSTSFSFCRGLRPVACLARVSTVFCTHGGAVILAVAPLRGLDAFGLIFRSLGLHFSHPWTLVSGTPGLHRL